MGLLPTTYIEDTKVGGLSVGQEEDQVPGSKTWVPPLIQEMPWMWMWEAEAMGNHQGHQLKAGGIHRSRDLEMGGVEVTLSYLWEGDGGRNERENLSVPGPCQLPTTPGHISLHS